MTFPFWITYKKRLTGKIEDFTTTQILEFVKNDFEASGVNFVSINEDLVSVKNDLIVLKIRPGFNFNRWVGVGTARFQILMEDNQRFAIYRFSTSRIFYVASIIALLFGLITKIYWIGLIAFGYLGLLNWSFKILQHWICFKDTFDDLIRESRKQLNE